MLSLCKPRRPLKAEMLRDPDWETRLYWRGTSEEFARLGRYCMQDVRAEESLSSVLPELPENEQRLWLLDLTINDRGIRVDAPSATAILRCIDTHSADMTKEFRRLTGLDSPKQRDATLRHLLALGVEMDGLTKGDVEKALTTTGNEAAKRILEIRQSLSKSSTAKYQAFIDARCSDDRIRGCFMYHGAGTGRWAGRIIQPQNFPRGSFGDVEPCIEMFHDDDLEGIKLLYGDPMVAASTCIRSMIVPAPGHDFVCADYSSIEGRVLAWIAGEESALDVYRRGRDPYKVAAAAIYHVGYDAVAKPQRQIGKVAELACIAEGERVLTDRGCVPIEQVTTDDLVWDGVDWVRHEGVVCRGEKEVFEYEGLTATPDHLVWVEGEPEPLYFGVAAASGAHLLQAGDGGKPVRVDRGYIPGEKVEPIMGTLLRSGEMHSVSSSILGIPELSYDREEQGMSAVFAAAENSEVADQTPHRGEAEMHESERPGMEELRSKGDNLRLCVRDGSRIVYDTDLRPSGAEDGAGQNRQLQGVRPRKSAMGDQRAESGESSCNCPVAGGAHGTMASLPQCCASAEESGHDTRRHIRVRSRFGQGKAQELEVYCRKVRVYDIVNAGPRHRFTVSGKLVHNCGYQGGTGAFNMMAVTYGVSVPEQEAQRIVEKWRDSRPMTTQLWRSLEDACRNAVTNPGRVTQYRDIKMVVRSRMLAIRLPSGRCLWYANPRIEAKDMKWGGTKDVIAFDGVNSTTRKWGTQYLYGGLLAENITQATARDLLVNGMFAVEAAGYPVVMHVHDEMVSEVPENFGSVEEYEKLMCTLPAWAEGLPLKAEGWRGKRYKK